MAGRFSIDAQLDAVAGLAGDVRTVCLRLGLDQDAACELELALVEAANNVISHGYRRGSAGRLEVIVEPDNRGGVRVDLLDAGLPIPEGTIENAGLEEPGDDVEALTDSGRGLALIKMSVDDWAYESGRDGNRLTLVKRPSA